MENEKKTVYESTLKVKSGEYRFFVKESSTSGRYLVIEDVRMKKGQAKSERIVLYPELMDGFDAEYQNAKLALAGKEPKPEGA